MRAVSLLVISGAGLPVFRGHAWPGGPVSFGALAAAAAWLRRRPGESRFTRNPLEKN